MSVKGRYRGPGDISTDERPLYVAISADAPEKADACLAVVCEIIQAAGPEPPPLGPIVCTKAAQRAALAHDCLTRTTQRYWHPTSRKAKVGVPGHLRAGLP